MFWHFGFCKDRIFFWKADLMRICPLQIEYLQIFPFLQTFLTSFNRPCPWRSLADWLDHPWPQNVTKAPHYTGYTLNIKEKKKKKYEAKNLNDPHTPNFNDNKERLFSQRLQNLTKENLEIRKSVSLLVDITQSPEGVKLNSGFIPLYGVWWDFGGILVTGNQSSYARMTH